MKTKEETTSIFFKVISNLYDTILEYYGFTQPWCISHHIINVQFLVFLVLKPTTSHATCNSRLSFPYTTLYIHIHELSRHFYCIQFLV